MPLNENHDSSGASAKPGLDERFGRAFGFELDQQGWFARLRVSDDGHALGRIGAYELLGEIARGGQGIVFKARQPRTGREIAIKRLSAGVFATPEMRARFEREVEAASALDHPNIVTVYGSEEIDGQPLLAMQWIDGLPFDRWAEKSDEAARRQSDEGEGDFSRDSQRSASSPRRVLREVLGVFLQVCDAVHHAHQRGVIHRDLKPSNILVVDVGAVSDRDSSERGSSRSETAPTALPKVLDFGLAKLHGDASSNLLLTQTGQFVGTPAYAAPEQICGDQSQVDVRTDVYALGAVLYQGLTGRTLFEHSGTLAELVETVRRREPMPPTAINPRLDREIDAIVLKAVAKDKDRRYSSVDALGSDIRRYLAGQAVLAHPPSTTYRVRKFVRQNRLAVGAATGIVLLLIAATAVSSTFYFRARDQRNEARLQQQRAEAAFAAETKQTEAAKRAAANHASVLKFLQDMLAKADPGLKDGRVGITVRETLDAAAKALAEGQVRYEPEVEASVRMALAETYAGLGLGLEALPHAEAALKLRKEALGSEHADVATSLFWLARLLRGGNRIAEAEAYHREGLAIRRKLLGPDSPYVAQSLVSLGVMIRSQQRHAEAEQAYVEARDIYRRAFGDEQYDVVNCTRNIGVLRLAQGRTEEAVSLLRNSLEMLRKLEGPETRTVAQCLQVLASGVYELGQEQEAEALVEQANAIYTKVYGPGYGEIANGIHARAIWAHVAGRHDDEESYARRALAILRKPGGPWSGGHIMMLGTVAKSLVHQGRFDEAHSLFLELAEASESDIGPQAPETLGARSFLGYSLGTLGRHAEGETLLLAAYYGLMASPGEVASLMRDAASYLVRLYESWEGSDPDHGHAAQADEWRERVAALDARLNMISNKPCDPPDEACAAGPQ